MNEEELEQTIRAVAQTQFMKPYLKEERKGFIVWLSADGYMDRTDDFGPYKTRYSALIMLAELMGIE